MNKSKLIVLGVILIVLGIAFTIIKQTRGSTLYYEELTPNFQIENAYPVGDEIGCQNERYIFKVINKRKDKNVNVYFFNGVTGEKKMANSNIRYQVYRNGEYFIGPTTLTEDGLIFTDIIDTEVTYELVYWIDLHAENDIVGTTFIGKIALI